MIKLPMSRAEAKAAGSKHYHTGLPCARGHIALRFTSIGKCMACAREDSMKAHVHTTSRRRRVVSTKALVEAAKEVHGAKYSYAKTHYVKAKAPVVVTCAIHGDFSIRPDNLIHGKGCRGCRDLATSVRCNAGLVGFVTKAVQLYGDKFDYHQVAYVDSHTKVVIGCKQHGHFEQTPTNHLTGKEACPKCNHMRSREEENIARLMAIFTPVAWRDKSILPPKELDILMPDAGLAIEYCGMYWHSYHDAASEKEGKKKHFEKYKLCQEKGIRLLTIYESEWLERGPALRRLLRNAVGKSRGKLMARKCELKKVATPEARAFYEKYHPQGGAGSGEHYGLYWKGKLVACMRFVLGANDRGAGAKERTWTLGRYATRVNVAGAASRLFKAFVQEFSPPEVKSFSDNRYFSGGMYEQLGFVLEEEVAPDYQVWSPKIGLRPKSHYQRRNLPARLKEHEVDEAFDPKTDPRTEAEMTYIMGCGRIYDCGKKRWVWKQN